MTQLALPLQLADHAVFSSFYSSGNEALVAILQSIARGEDCHGVWASGTQASGKTHLLQAVCEAAGDQAVYLPMSLLLDGPPEVLDGMASRPILCVDDIDAVAGNSDWEQALFALCNQAIDDNVQLVVAAASAPRESGFVLADLASRLSRLPVFRIHSLNEGERVLALQMRAKHRGLELPDDTAAYLLRRKRRDMGSLYELLDTLDKAALVAQRRLTIPFVRDVISAASADAD